MDAFFHALAPVSIFVFLHWQGISSSEIGEGLLIYFLLDISFNLKRIANSLEKRDLL